MKGFLLLIGVFALLYGICCIGMSATKSQRLQRIQGSGCQDRAWCYEMLKK